MWNDPIGPRKHVALNQIAVCCTQSSMPDNPHTHVPSAVHEPPTYGNTSHTVGTTLGTGDTMRHKQGGGYFKPFFKNSIKAASLLILPSS